MMLPFDTALLHHPAARHRPSLSRPRAEPLGRAITMPNWLVILVLRLTAQGGRA